MDKKLQKIIETFRQCSIEISKLEPEEYKVNNRLVKKRAKAYESIAGDEILLKEFFEVLLNDGNVFVKRDAIVYLGNNNHDKKLALKMIKELMDNKDFSEFDRLAISMAIERWEKELKGTN